MIAATVIDEAGIETRIPGKPDEFPWLGNGLAGKNSGTLDGWWVSPDPRAEDQPRPQADGAFAPWQLLVGARVVTLVFHARRPTKAAAMEFKRYITSWTKQWLTLVVEEEGFVSHVRGHISERPEVEKINETTNTFTVILTCPDPLKYEGHGGDGYQWWNTVSGRYGSDAEGGLLFPAFDQEPRDDVSSSPSGPAAALAPSAGQAPELWELNNGAYIFNSNYDAEGKGIGLPINQPGQPRATAYGPIVDIDPGGLVAYKFYCARRGLPTVPSAELYSYLVFADAAGNVIEQRHIATAFPRTNFGFKVGQEVAPSGSVSVQFMLETGIGAATDGIWGVRNFEFVNPGYGFTARFTEQGLTNSALVVNVGNSPTWPVLEADGPFDWARFVYDGHVIRWEATVPSGMTLRINTHTGAVEIGGLRVVPSALVNDDFFQLPAGTSSVAFASSHPTNYRVRWLSAWM